MCIVQLCMNPKDCGESRDLCQGSAAANETKPAAKVYGLCPSQEIRRTTRPRRLRSSTSSLRIRQSVDLYEVLSGRTLGKQTLRCMHAENTPATPSANIPPQSVASCSSPPANDKAAQKRAPKNRHDVTHIHCHYCEHAAASQ